MTGSLSVTIAKRSNVLVVPTSAVSGDLSSSFVQVMQNGKPTYRQVTTGLSTSSLTQITSGLVAGEVVVTGTYTNSASSTTSSGNGLGGLGGLGGGGSLPALQRRLVGRLRRSRRGSVDDAATLRQARTRHAMIVALESLRMAFASLRANPLRAVLTILGIVIGVAPWSP